MASILTLFRHTPGAARALLAAGMLCIATFPLLAGETARDGSREPDIVGRNSSEAIVGRNAPGLLDTPDLSYLEYGLNDAIVLNHDVRRGNGDDSDSQLAQSNGSRGRGSGSGNASGSGNDSRSGSESDSADDPVAAEGGLQASVDIENSGGAPLLLTIRVDIDDQGSSDGSGDRAGDTDGAGDSDGAESTDNSVSQVFVRTESGSFAMDTPDRDEFVFQVSPFREAGVYDLEVLLLNADRRVLAEERFEVGFADFRYGRDNFNFAHDGESRHGSVEPYSPVLRDWLSNRFDIDEPGAITETIVLSEIYDIFARTVGRGYAFSGSKERYFRFPEEWPSWYDYVYEVRESDTRHQARMNRLQNDLLFEHFVFGDRDPEGEQSASELSSEVDELRERIARGDPATISYLTPDRHHAMLVYGYIQREEGEHIDLITSNNRARDNARNLENEDAGIVRVDLQSGSASWVNAPARAYESAEQVFVADVRAQAEDYDFREADLEQFVERRTDELRDEERAILVVEMVSGAALVNSEGLRAGTLDNRNYEEFEGVEVRRTDNNVRFTFDPQMDLELKLEGLEVAEGDSSAEDSGSDVYDAHIYSFTPSDSEDTSSAVVGRDVRLSADEQREFALTSGLIDWDD